MIVSEILTRIRDWIKTGIPFNVKSSNMRALLTWMTIRMDAQEVGRLKIIKASGNSATEQEVGDFVTGIIENAFVANAIYRGGDINLLENYTIADYLPLTGGTLTGSLSAQNLETEKGIEFISNIEISKLIESGELAVRITDTGVPIYVFNETGTPTNPKDVITKEFFDANAGGDNIPIEVTNDENRTTVIKTCTTVSGNYIPQIGDDIVLHLVQGSTTTTQVSLIIDGGTAYPVKFLGRYNLVNATEYITDSKIRLWFDGTAWNLYGSQFRVPSTSTLNTLITGTQGSGDLQSPRILNEWIDQKYVPMLNKRIITLILTPLGEDLTVGFCEYVYTVQEDCKLLTFRTSVQVAPSGSQITSSISNADNDQGISQTNSLIVGDDFNSSNNPSIFPSREMLVAGQRLKFEIRQIGVVTPGQCLTMNLHVELT